MDVENGSRLSSLKSEASRRNDSDVSIHSIPTNLQRIAQEKIGNSLNELTDEEKTETVSMINIEENKANETESKEGSCEESLKNGSLGSKESEIDFQGKY